MTATSSLPLQLSSLEINDYSDDENDDDEDFDEDYYDEDDFDGHVEPWNTMDVRHRRKPARQRCGIILAVTALFVLVVSLFFVALLSVYTGSSSHAATTAITAEDPIYGTAHLTPDEYHNVRRSNGRESVLVTGGLGFIGSHVVELLLHRGFTVTILDDESNGHNHNMAAVELVPKDITIITDLPSFPNINASVNKEESTNYSSQNNNQNKYYTHVVHLAAAISVSESIIDPNKYERINYGGSQKILDWIHRYNEHIVTFMSSSATASASSSSNHLMTIRKVVAASSAAIYGDPDSTLLPLQENAPYGGLSPYADTKYRMEQLLHDFAATNTITATAEAATTTTKVCATALRFFNVYGPRQDPKNPYSGVISLFLQMAISNSDITILGDGYMTRDFVYVKDVARAIVLSLLQEDDTSDDNFNVYNVCTGTSITINTLAKRIKSIMKSTSKIIHTTPRVGDIRESECNPTLAKVGLGFEIVVSQESGLEKTADWFRQNIRR